MDIEPDKIDENKQHAAIPGFLWLMLLSTPIIICLFPLLLSFQIIAVTSDAAKDKFLAGGILGIICGVFFLLFSSKKVSENWAKFREHPVITSIILFGVGICLLQVTYFALYPCFKWFSAAISTPKQNIVISKIYFLAPMDFIKKIGITTTITIWLAPYFYMLWIWRHNNTERQMARNEIEDHLNLFTMLFNQITSGVASTQITGLKSIRRFLENLPDNEPNLEFFYQQVIETIANFEFLKGKNSNDTFDRVFIKATTECLETLQCRFHTIYGEYLETKSPISVFLSEQQRITNACGNLIGSFPCIQREYIHCEFDKIIKDAFFEPKRREYPQTGNASDEEQFLNSLNGLSFKDCRIIFKCAKNVDPGKLAPLIDKINTEINGLKAELSQ